MYAYTWKVSSEWNKLALTPNKLFAVWWRVFMQYGGGISSIRWKIFSTDVSHHQYGGGVSSVQWRACNMDLSHYQYRGGCAAHDYQNCSRGSWWLYLSGKMTFYRQYNPNFILLWWIKMFLRSFQDANMITFGSLDNSSVIRDPR